MTDPATVPKIPAWGWLVVVGAPIVGVAELLLGNYFWGVLLVAGSPVGFAIRLYRRRRGAQPPTDEPADVASWLLRWAIGYQVCAAFFLVLGSLAIPSGIPMIALGLPVGYLGVRVLQHRHTVQQLGDFAEGHAFGTLVVLVGRETGPSGLARRGWVIGVDDARLAIARASFREAAWEVRALTEVSKFEAHLKQAAGDLFYADAVQDLHLTAILARPLRRAEALVAAAPR